MAQIRIERTPIQRFGLGYAGADHLLLTYVVDEFAREQIQDNWFVLEGTKDTDAGILGVSGTNGVTTLSDANGGLQGSALVAAIGTPQSRRSTVIDLPIGAAEAWDIMTNFGGDIDDQFYPYVLFGRAYQVIPTSNSSSVIATVLYHAGVDISNVLSFGWRNFTTGTTTLLGTSERDEYFVTSNFKDLLGGGGSDILHGGSGDNRLLGGKEADLLYWSEGSDYLHGGQSDLDYRSDGEDVASFGGAGPVRIEHNAAWAEHRAPTYIAFYASGKSYLYSIERLQWNDATDTIILGRNVEMIIDDLLFDLKGDGGGQGDKTSLIDATDDLLVNVVSDDTLVVQGQSASNGKGYYIQSSEWLEGSGGDDIIYANSGLRGVEGGAGNDHIDARLAARFSGASPAGYDIELLGGSGNDTLLSGEGRTLVTGGEGADRIVFTTVKTGEERPELVIDQADEADRLFIAYNFFNGSGGGFEGSQLMPVLGALYPLELIRDPNSDYSELYFEWATLSDLETRTSQATGIFDFYGGIDYSLDGDDLIIKIFQGEPEEVEIGPEGGPSTPFTLVRFEPEKYAVVRVRNYEPGDLGLQFIDPGEPQPTDNGDFYPNWDEAVRTLTNNGEFLAPFDPRPQAPTYAPSGNSPDDREVETSGTEGDDTIIVATAARVDAGSGNDSVTGSASGDRLDGGAGDDTLSGRAGDDVYVVDSSSDIVVEIAGEGVDRVVSTVDHRLAEHVENLDLVGAAVRAVGNAINNRLVGNDIANVIDGGGGNDALVGGLGDDTLVGGEGSDGYLYLPDEGEDLIIDAGRVTDIDSLVFGGGILPSDVTIYRRAAAPSDLVLAVAGGGHVVIRDFALTDATGIDRVLFDDGTAWTRADLIAAGASAVTTDNDPPQAADDEFLLVSSANGILRAGDLLVNDRDPGGDALRIVAVGNAQGGSVVLEADGDLRVATADGREGTVSFDYTITDDHGGTASAHAVVDVVANTDPVTIGTVPSVTSPSDAAVDVTLPAGIFGDADGDPLAISATLADGSPLPAWLVFDNVAGRLSGQPPLGFAGDLAIQIAASDSYTSVFHEFTLSISAPNAAPVLAADGPFATASGAALAIATASLLGNDTDADGDPLSVVDVTAIAGGSVTLDGGLVTFTPVAGFSGRASFSYSASDGRGGVVAAVVTVDVAPQPGQTFTGTSAAETFTGTAGDDVFAVVGDGGNDIIDGGAGFDVWRGSAFNDIFRIAAGVAGVTNLERIEGGDGNDRILGGATDDVIDLSALTLLSIEGIDGGAGNDTVTGTSGADTITGGFGNDRLSGGGGDDVFAVVGDGGNDIIDGGAGFDVWRGSAFNDIFRIAAGVASATNLERIEGGDGNDRILGGATDDVIDLSAVTLLSIEGIDGGAGNDTVTGTSDADTITGGFGNDRLSGGGGDDVFAVVGDGGNDIIDGGTGFDVWRGSAFNDIFRFATGVAGVTNLERIEGGDGNDRILGGATDDVIDLSAVTLVSIEGIDGGAGNDTLTGTSGSETFTGGAGQDVFVFRGSSGHDQITDFQLGDGAAPIQDRLDFSGLGFQDFAEVAAAAAMIGSDTVITLETGASIRLLGVDMSALRPDDIIL